MHTQRAGSSKTAARSVHASCSTGDFSKPQPCPESSFPGASLPYYYQSSFGSDLSSKDGQTIERMLLAQARGEQGHSINSLPDSSPRTSPCQLFANADAPEVTDNEASLPGGSCEFGAAERTLETGSPKALQLSHAAMRRMRDPRSPRASGACDRTLQMLEALSRAGSQNLSCKSGGCSGNMGAKLRRSAQSLTAACSCHLEALEANIDILVGEDGKEVQEGLHQQQQQRPLTLASPEAPNAWLPPLAEKKALQSAAGDDSTVWNLAKGIEPASGVSPVLTCQGLQQTVEENTDYKGGEHIPHGTGDLGRSGSVKVCADRPSPMNAPKALFEVFFHPIKPEPSRRPLAMMSITDISESQQVQAALMALAEGQLLLLSSLLPQHAIEFLAHHSCTASAPVNMPSLARCHHQVTLLFLDIVGFTSMAKMVEPQSVMNLLNNLFSIFDALTDQYKVHKVETAGDCYIASAGVLSPEAPNGFHSTMETHDHAYSARRVMEFAKAVLRESAKVKMPHSGAPVEVRIGIHTGDVVSGMVGSKLPKFSLFRDCMNSASRMESNGKPGRIQVSETTRALLPKYAWKAAEIMVKGKWNNFGGWSQAALLRRNFSFTSPLPDVQPILSNSGQAQGATRSTPLLRFSRGTPNFSEQGNLLMALRAMETLVPMK